MEFENILYHLNCRWSIEAFSLWKGSKAFFGPQKIYEGYEDFISLDTLEHINRIGDTAKRKRLKHSLIDHYLQRELLPHEAEMRTWLKGAAANVNNEKIYYHEIIPWCQKSSTHKQRLILQKETSALCKFLKPFALNYWNILLDILQKEIGFKDYPNYCGQKKGVEYRSYYKFFKDFLLETDDLYFSAMDRWCKKRFSLPLDGLTRFDAVNLLGLGEFDSIFPARALEELMGFFKYWHIDLEKIPGLGLELGREKGKSSQALCFFFQIPEEVCILMRPEGGWVDIETLWHELGHGLSAVFTSPELSIADRDLASTYSLSESFAFLFQNLVLSRPFMEGFLSISSEKARELSYCKTLRDLSLFRRYAAKFIVEFEMFSNDDLSNGDLYAELMKRYTGFYYQPESHLFDLTPEFYCVDYLIGWMAEAVLEAHLKERLGINWIFESKTGQILKKWWGQGNQYNIFDFFDKNNIGTLTPDPLLKRWTEILA